MIIVGMYITFIFSLGFRIINIVKYAAVYGGNKS